MNMWKKSLFLFLFVSVTIFLSGCENTAFESDEPIEEPVETGTAHFRFIHSASSYNKIGLVYKDYTNGYFYFLQENMSYGHQYGYFDFSARNQEVRAVPSNTNLSVAQDILPLVEDKRYTVIAYDYEATIAPDFLFMADTVVTAGDGNAYIRFVHAISDVETISILQQDSSQFIPSLNPTSNSGYKKLASGTYQFKIADISSGEFILNAAPQTFLSNQNYTIVISGSAGGMTPVFINLKIYPETGL